MFYQKFLVSGTKNQDCEKVIEGALKKLEGVVSVSVWHNEGTIDIQMEGTKFQHTELNAILDKYGYKVLKNGADLGDDSSQGG